MRKNNPVAQQYPWVQRQEYKTLRTDEKHKYTSKNLLLSAPVTKQAMAQTHQYSAFPQP